MSTAHDNFGTLKYRPDIDGLRAISIIGVLVFHFFPERLRGGFVGVDVFFVISGFLIGGLIFDEVEQGKLDMLGFYGRRIRRIFPALIVILAATYAAGWFILFPEEFRVLGKQMAAAALFVSNFILLRESGYFDAAFQTKPLLHLWSLAIEEQFYLFWPLYVWLTIRNRARFVKLTIALCLASFVLGLVLESRVVAFYVPLSRFWEILSGSLLAFAVRQPVPVGIAKWRPWCCWPGLVLIIVAMIITPAKDFPGWWALPPVLGSCLIVFAGPLGLINRHILSRRPLVFVGLISYPLYLWHWPLISYAWIVDGSAGYEAWIGNGPPVGVRLVLMALAVVLACLTYLFIERPIRFGSNRVRKAVFTLAALAALGLVGAGTMFKQGIPNRSVAQINQVMAEDIKIPTDTRVSDGSCLKIFGVDVQGSSVCLANSDKPVVMFVGDSQAMALYSAIYRKLIDLPTVLVASHDKKAECLKQIDFDVWAKGNEPCQIAVRAMLEILASTPSIRTVVIHYQDDGPFFLDRAKIERMQDEFLKDGREVVYALGEPGFWKPITSCRPRQIFLFGFDISPDAGGVCRQERETLANNQFTQREYIRQLSKGNPRVYVYDILRAICDDRYCYQAGSEGAWFWSLEHVNEKGSVRMLRDFLAWAKLNLHFLK